MNPRKDKILYKVWFSKEEADDLNDALNMNDKNFVFELIKKVTERGDFNK